MKKALKTVALTASLALAAAATFGTAASAQKWQRDPVCDQQQAANCASNWQALGWPNEELCVGGQQCLECPPNYGYMCPNPDIYNEYAARPEAGDDVR